MAGIIASLKPSNPIDSHRTEEIKKCCTRVLECFAKNYLTATKDVLIEIEEEKLIKQDKLKAKQEKRALKLRTLSESGQLPTTSGAIITSPIIGDNKPRRPRGPKQPPKGVIVTKITNTETTDSDIDPFIEFTVVSAFNNLQGVRTRRYKEFKSLFGSLKNACPKAVLPPGTQFGKHIFEHDFVENRRKGLAEMLEAFSQVEELKTNKGFLTFLGLLPSEDPREDLIFARAIRMTKWDLWNWRKLTWDSQGEAISKLIIEEIRRDMWYDIVSSCPPSAAARRTALKLASRTITALVTPPVTVAWNAAAEAAKPVKVAVVDAVASQCALIIQTKHAVKQKIMDSIGAVLSPLTNCLADILGGVMDALVPVCFEALSPIKGVALSLDTELRDAFHANDADKIRSIGGRLEDEKGKAFAVLDAKFTEICEALIAKMTAKITGGDALKSALTPVGCLGRLLQSLTKMITFKFWSEVVVRMIDEKKDIQKAGAPASLEDLNKRLDRMEEETRWWTWYWGWDIRSAGCSAWWELHSVDLGIAADFVYDLAYSIDKNLHKKIFKKFAFKFGDYLYGFAANPADTRSWDEKVDAAFIIGYECALHRLKKTGFELMAEQICEIPRRHVLGPLEKAIFPLITEVLTAVESLIPSPLRSILEIPSTARAAISEAVSRSSDGAIFFALNKIAPEGVVLAVH